MPHLDLSMDRSKVQGQVLPEDGTLDGTEDSTLDGVLPQRQNAGLPTETVTPRELGTIRGPGPFRSPAADQSFQPRTSGSDVAGRTAVLASTGGRSTSTPGTRSTVNPPLGIDVASRALKISKRYSLSAAKLNSLEAFGKLPPAAQQMEIYGYLQFLHTKICDYDKLVAKNWTVPPATLEIIKRVTKHVIYDPTCETYFPDTEHVRFFFEDLSCLVANHAYNLCRRRHNLS